MEEERRKILAADCDDFIHKPYKDVEIYDALSKHLEVLLAYEEEALLVLENTPPLTILALAELPATLRTSFIRKVLAYRLLKTERP
jgi:hypothetical protein